MKFLAALLFSAFTTIAMAQPAHDHDHGAPAEASPKSDAQGHRGVGVVKSVNAAKQTATIQHEAVQSLKWPAMTMAFKAQDAKTLEQLKPGANVRFEFEQRGKEYVITSVNPAWGSCTPDCTMNKH